MKIILWTLAILSAMVLLYRPYYYFKGKLFFWWNSKKINRMAKKYAGTETGDNLKKLADDMKQFGKESKPEDYFNGEE